MAVSKDSINFCDDSKNLDISVVGEFDGLEIVEEACDSDESGCTGLAANVARPAAAAPVFGAVTVSNSENVQFGNNTYFQGPVIIKQLIQNKSGIENSSYDKTDHESTPNPPIYKEENIETEPESCAWKTWHKVTISAVLFVIVSACGITFGLQKLPDSSDDDMTSDQVAGASHDYCSEIKMIVIIVTPFISAWASYRVLTINTKHSIYFSRRFSRTKNKNADFVKKKSKAIAGEQGEIFIARDHLRIVSRAEWLAQPPTAPLDKLRLPAPWVIIAHTAADFCLNQSSCVYNVRLVQQYHVESRGWYDIGYNFLVGGDGSAYYGRGWDYIGAHTLGYNKYSICIAFIGTFTHEAPPQKQLDACKKLIRRGVAEGKIAKDYKLFAHRQFSSTESPGSKLVEILREWPHFTNDLNATVIPPNY